MRAPVAAVNLLRLSSALRGPVQRGPETIGIQAPGLQLKAQGVGRQLFAAGAWGFELRRSGPGGVGFGALRGGAEQVGKAEVGLWFANRRWLSSAPGPLTDADKLRAIAEAGDSEAQLELAGRHFSGRGIEKDVKQSEFWLQKAAIAGNPEAQFRYAGMCYNGIGREDDVSEALDWYCKAADQGHAEAQACAAELFKEGLGWHLKDRKKAEHYYLLAAEQGVIEAQYELGLLYQLGLDVGKNFQKAADYMRKAAEQGHAEAQGVLGTMYYKGVGVQQSDTEAAKWTQMSADQGVAAAQYNLAGFLLNGIGLPMNREKAIEACAEAAKGGYKPAQMMLIELSRGAGPKGRQEGETTVDGTSGNAIEALWNQASDIRR